MTVEPGPLPATDRLRESDGWKTTLSPRLDRQDPAQLDHLRPFITRLGLLDRLRMAGKDVLEETPMGAATQETHTHGNESSEVYDGVGSEVVELRVRRNSGSSGKKDGAAEKTRGRHGWLGARTHRRGAEVRSLSPGDARLRGE